MFYNKKNIKLLRFIQNSKNDYCHKSIMCCVFKGGITERKYDL
jgi:predicted small secreted protein